LPDVYLFSIILRGLKYKIIYDFPLSYKSNIFIKIVFLLEYLNIVLHNVTWILTYMKLVNPAIDFKCPKCIFISSNPEYIFNSRLYIALIVG